MADEWQSFERLDFEPTYDCKSKELHRIPDFKAPDWLLDAARHAQQFEAVVFKPVQDGKLALKAMLATDPVSSSRPICYLQIMDRRNLLGQVGRFTLFHHQGTFTAADENATTVGDTPSALIRSDGSLVFHSYPIVKQLIDLREHFCEATDDNIRAVLGHACVHCPPDQWDKVIAMCDDLARKRLSVAIRDGVLDKLTAEQLVARAKGFGIQVSYTGAAGGRRLVFPTEPNILRLFLEVLTDGFYESILDSRQFRSNSHRPHRR